MTLKVNVQQWHELNSYSPYFRDWSEKALKVNKDIGDSPTYENGREMWRIYCPQNRRLAVNFGFYDNGEFSIDVPGAGRYKDPQKKLFSKSDVEEIMLAVVNAVGAFYKAGILEVVDD